MNVDILPALNILGWMSPTELTFLAERAREAEIIFEAGSFYGRSTRAMADNTEGVVYAIDPWNSPYIAVMNGQVIGSNDAARSMFYANLYPHIKSKRVLMKPMEFTKFEPEKKADFIFIDAMHEYEPVRADILHAFKLIKPGGIIAGHDFCHVWPGVVKAVKELFPKFHVVDSIWWVQR